MSDFYDVSGFYEKSCDQLITHKCTEIMSLQPAFGQLCNISKYLNVWQYVDQIYTCIFS